MTSRQDTRFRHHQQQHLAALANANNENALASTAAHPTNPRTHAGLPHYHAPLGGQHGLVGKPTVLNAKPSSSSAALNKPTVSLIPTAAGGPTTRAAAAAAAHVPTVAPSKQNATTKPKPTTTRPTRVAAAAAAASSSAAQPSNNNEPAGSSGVAGVKRTASRQPKVMTDQEQQLAHLHQAKVAPALSAKSLDAIEEVAPVPVPSKARKTAGAKSARSAAAAARGSQDDTQVDSGFHPDSASPVPPPERQQQESEAEEEEDQDVESPRSKRLRLCDEVARQSGEVPIVARDPRTGTLFTLEDPDEEDVHDPAMCAEYVQEIMDYLTKREKLFQPNPHYVACQGDMSWSMRSVLVDWLFEVHKKFEFLPETMFLAINIMDRFMSLRRCEIGKFQLVGLTSLFIAAKMEEIIAPQVSSLVYMADNGFADTDMLTAEQYILRTLDFDLWAPGPFSFIRRISKADDYDLQNRNLAKYLVEVALLDHRFLVYPMSQIAAGAFFLARAINVTHVSKAGVVGLLDIENRDEAFQWSVQFVHASGYRDTDLVPILALFADFFGPRVQAHSKDWSFFTNKLQGSKRFRDIAVRIDLVIDILQIKPACERVVKEHEAMDEEATREAKLGEEEAEAEAQQAAAAEHDKATGKHAAKAKAKGGRRGTRKQLPLAEME